MPLEYFCTASGPVVEADAAVGAPEDWIVMLAVLLVVPPAPVQASV